MAQQLKHLSDKRENQHLDPRSPPKNWVDSVACLRESVWRQRQTVSGASWVARLS